MKQIKLRAVKMRCVNMYDLDSFRLPSIDYDAIQRSVAKINVDSPAQHMWSDEQFEILKKYIQDFEKL